MKINCVPDCHQIQIRLRRLMENIKKTSEGTNFHKIVQLKYTYDKRNSSEYDETISNGFFVKDRIFL